MLAATVTLAACSSTSGVSEVESGPTGGSVPSSSLAPAPVDGSTPVTAPDPTGLPSLTQPDPDVLVGELDNGLRYLIRDNDNPGGRVEMRLAIDAGSVLEDDSQVGGAHFLEHMLFNGTEEFPENELVAVLRGFGAGFGADINASTSYDETVYELTMPTQDPTVVTTGLDVLEQWLSAATIDQAQVEAERGVVLDEWRGSESGSGGRIYDALEQLFLEGSPYEGRDPIGTDAAITTTDAAELRSFYDDWYRPDNAAIVVAGDIDPATMEAGIVERFSTMVPRGASPDRPAFTVDQTDRPEVLILADPDVAQGWAQVTLPLSVPDVDAATPEPSRQNSVLDALAFDIIATRLGNDARRGESAFDDARVDSSSLVRGLDAPEIVVTADGEALEASTQAVFDEYERVRRFGFSQTEVDRAVSSARTLARSEFDGRDSRQDALFADEYVRHVLTDEPIPTADARYAFANAVLDRATPETIAYRFVDRLAAAEPHVLVVVPSREIVDVPDEEVFFLQAADMRDRVLEARGDETGIDGDLMTAPEPIREKSRAQLSSDGSPDFIDPTVLEFDNGVRVSLNRTQIVDGQVFFEARSPGGLAVVTDEDVPAADAAGEVIGNSGVANYDPVSLDDFLSDRDVSLQLGIESFTEGMSGTSSAGDLEVLFQLINLSMTQPRIDPIALDKYLDDSRSFATDPSIDAGYAEYVALLQARYDDPRYLLPTVESLNSVTADDIDRVFRDRFGDASDFSFAFSGDFDLDDTVDLARRYLGTLPSTGRAEQVDYVEQPPPGGVTSETVTAGTGAQARLTLLFTAPASADPRDVVVAAILQEVITARLTDTVREELGDSYSPSAQVQISSGGTPNAEIYISNTTGPELVDEVNDAVLGQLADLRAAPPSTKEFAAARENVRQQLDLFSNEQINDEVLAVFTDPAGHPSFDEFLRQAGWVDTIDAGDIRRVATAWLPADQYIEIRVLPR